MSEVGNFYIKFKADTKTAKKSIDETKKSVEEFGNSLGQIGRTGIPRTVTSLISLGAAFSAIKSTIASIQTLGDASRALNVNVEALDAWGHAVQRTGGNAQSFQSSLKNLAKHFNTTHQIAMEQLPELAEGFGRLNDIQARIYGQYLGLDPATIYLLQKGRRETEKLVYAQRELGLVTQRDAEAARSFNDSLYDLRRAITTIKREGVTPFLGGLTDVVDYLVKHKLLIEGIFTGLAGFILATGAAFLKANPHIRAFALALGAIALAYEDIQKYIQGAPSVVGAIAEGVTKRHTGTERLLGKILPSWLSDEGSAYKFLEGMGVVPEVSRTSISNGARISINKVEVTTQATDAQGIARDFASELNNALQNANAQFDNPVKI